MRKNRLSSTKRGFRILLCAALAALALSVAACNLPFGPNASAGSGGMSLAQALAVTPVDNRPGILKQLGEPDAFTISFEDLNGKTVREDEWSYFDDQTRVDFVDGTLVWTLTIDPMPDTTLYASLFDPLAFNPQMTPDDARTLFPDQMLLEVDTADNGYPGGLVLAGSQIVMGFDQGHLVYVETFALAPEVRS